MEGERPRGAAPDEGAPPQQNAPAHSAGRTPPPSRRRTPAQVTGDEAESVVAARLASAGWTILGRQVRVGRRELDLVAVDPGPPPSLVCVEVRWRSRRDFGLPEETVDHRKLNDIRAAAFELVGRGRLPDGSPLPRLPTRLDLVAVEPGGRMRHHRHMG